MRRYPLSLKLSIPVSLILCSSLLGITSFNREVTETYQQTETAAKDNIQILGGQTARILDYLYREGNLESTLETIISQLGSDPNIELVMLIDEQNIINQANRYELKQASFSKTQSTDYSKEFEFSYQQEFDDVRLKLSGKVLFSIDRNKMIAFYPVLLEVLPNEIRPSRVGILFFEYDLHQLKKQAFNKALRRSLIFNGTSILLYVGLWFFFEFTLTRRVSKLVLVSNTLADGNLEIRSELNGSDELAQISVAFDRMASKIQENTNNLEKELIERQIIESKLKTINEELSVANIELQAATKAKSLFLANMSHEIRTPMNGVIGIAQMLEMTALSEEQKDLVHTIRDSGDALLTIINDILDFSKIESGNLKLEQKPFLLQNIIKSVCNLLSKQATNKLIELNYLPQGTYSSYLLGDAVRLRQILLNLIGNAIKFTGQGGVIISSVAKPIPSLIENNEPQQFELMIKIQDSGIGIDPDQLSHLFQAFTQADESITRKYGGTGLGLVICKNLIELMGGTIWVQTRGAIGGSPPKDWLPDPNQNISSGSTFYFTFVAQGVVHEELVEKTVFIPPQTAELRQLYPLKIMLAEDNKVNQKVMELILSNLGYQADIANNGLEVLAYINKETYDIILMDMQMPEMDGLTATKLIRQSFHAQPYIVALTANALEEDRHACIEVGMNDFLTKPVAIEDISRVFSNYINMISPGS